MPEQSSVSVQGLTVLQPGPATSQPGTGSALATGLPPGTGWPSIVQTVALLWFMERWVRWGHQRFDSPWTTRVLGLGEVVSVWDPDLVKQVFAGDSDVLHAGEANARVLGRVAPSSLLALDGARHVRMRRLLSPPFHGDAVRKYRQLIEELAAAEVQRWPVGEEFAIYPRMQAIALEVILRAVVGVRDPVRMARLRTLLPKMAGASALAFVVEARNPRLADGWIGARLPWVRARREAEVLLHEEIAAHRSDPDGREDVLAGLMAACDENGEPLTDEELRDQLVTLLIAGQETTATALAWCLAAAAPPAVLDARARARWRRWRCLSGRGHRRDAARAPSADARMASAEGSVGARRLSAPCGDDRQRDDHLGAPIQGVPGCRAVSSRAVPRSAAAVVCADPFGGGPRRCIGASFALMEMRTILRTVLERVELRAPTQKPERAVRTRRITTVPARGGRVLVTSKGPSTGRCGRSRRLRVSSGQAEGASRRRVELAPSLTAVEWPNARGPRRVRPRPRPPAGPRGAPPGRVALPDPLRELLLAGRARGERHRAREQVRRGVSGQALLRGQRGH